MDTRQSVGHRSALNFEDNPDESAAALCSMQMRISRRFDEAIDTVIMMVDYDLFM